MESREATVLSFSRFSGVGLKSIWSTPRSITGRLVAIMLPRESVMSPRRAFMTSNLLRAFSVVSALSGPRTTCRK